MRILLADCGSTKCDWALVDQTNGALIESFKSAGLNLAISSIQNIRLFTDVLPTFDDVSRVEFYGAGAKINLLNDEELAAGLSCKYGCRTEVGTDLEGAAKALFGNKPGIACILGTGSNSGVYDGEKILANTPPLGFILGDEGSGAALGKRLVNAIFKGLLPSDLTEAFFAEYTLTKQELIERVYRQPGANFFLAQFSKFLSAHIDRNEIALMVEDEFTAFFAKNLTPYKLSNPDSLGFVGSIATYFTPQLLVVASRFYPDIDPATIRILPAPIRGLIAHAITK